VQSDPAEALKVLYRLRQKWAESSGADAETILNAIDSLIAEYETARDPPEDG
jgi:hypothetical protein